MEGSKGIWTVAVKAPLSSARPARCAAARTSTAYAAALATCLAIAPPSVFAAAEQGPSKTSAVVVAVDPLDAQAMLRQARRADRDRPLRQWQAVRVVPARAAPPRPPLDLLERARQAYVDAEFDACLAQLDVGELELERLLRDSLRAVAAERAVLQATCLYGSGREAEARKVLRDAHAKELALNEAIDALPSDLRNLIAEERAAIHAQPRAGLTVSSDPAGTRVVANGGAIGCPHTPCTIQLLPGQHVIAIRPGTHDEAATTVAVTARSNRGAQQIMLRAQPLSAEQARARLAALLASEERPSQELLGQLAARAFSADLVLVVMRKDVKIHGFSYDARASKVVARASSNAVHKGEAATNLVATLLQPASVVAAPQPSGSGWRKRMPWIIAGGAALAATLVGVLIWTQSSSGETRYDVAFR